MTSRSTTSVGASGAGEVLVLTTHPQTTNTITAATLSAIAMLPRFSADSRPGGSTAPVLIPFHKFRLSSSTYRLSMPGDGDIPVFN